MFESLTRFCSEEYEVVRVYDVNYRSLVSTEGKLRLQIHNPEELAEDYRNGLFEKVLLCFLWYDILTEAKNYLINNSISWLHLGSEGDFFPASSFEQGIKPFDIQQEGYSFCVLKKLYGVMANYESNELLYLFNNEGKVLQEHWSHWLAKPNVHVYDYPFVLKNSKAEKSFLKGQYCILTKQNVGNYWHFTYQCMDIVWLLEKAGYRGKYIVPNKHYCNEILHMLGVVPERIIPLGMFEHNRIYVFEEVFCVSFSAAKEIYGTDVLIKAAADIKKKLPVDLSLPKKLYIKRTGIRKLLEADALLEEYGFTSIIPENYTVKEQMTLFYNADIVFSVHGANSTNCLYMRKNTVFIEAFSNFWKDRWNLYTMAAGKTHYLPIISLENDGECKNGRSEDFKIRETLLRMSIENAFLIYKAEHL